MKRHYLILMAAIVFAGCSHRTSDSLEQLGDAIDKSNNAWSATVTNTAQAYFRAGVEIAITVHFMWVKGELMQGRNPSIAGNPDWSNKAKEFWATNFTNDAYIKLP